MQYYAQLRQEENNIDAYTASANQSAATWGILVVLIGLVVLLTPFVKSLQNFQRFSLPKLAIVAPIILGLVVGAFIGLAVSFGACFKQECSRIESSALLIAPAASLILTLPIAWKIYKKRQGITDSVSRSKPLGWVAVGSLIIILALARTASVINNNYRSNSSQKSILHIIYP